jgi:peptidoglycan/xylan/chitin deacetylase (PgdA/CDA1 family)
MKAFLRSTNRYVRSLFRPRVLVLMYHHVCPPGSTPPYMTVSPERFEEQMAFLARRGIALSMDRMLGDLSAGRFAGGGWVLVTFDDAGTDTARYAVPILRRYRVPATVFVPTGLIGGGEFWWNRLYLLAEHAAGRGIDLYHWLGQRHPELAGPDPESTLWRRLRLFPPPAIEEILAAAATYLGNPGLRPSPGPMSTAELDDLGRGDGLITLGAHTVTHPMLEAIPDEQLEWELGASRAALRRFPAYRDVLAYPYGDAAVVTPRVRRAARAAGFAAAFTTARGAVFPQDDRWGLPRIGIEDGGLDGFRWAIDHYSCRKASVAQ